VQGDGAISGRRRYWRPQPGPAARTNDAHLPAVGSSGFAPAMQYRTSLQTALDANTVDLDVERANFCREHVLYEAGPAFHQRPDSHDAHRNQWPVMTLADCYSFASRGMCLQDDAVRCPRRFA